MEMHEDGGESRGGIGSVDWAADMADRSEDSVMHTDGFGTLRPRCESLAVFGFP